MGADGSDVVLESHGLIELRLLGLQLSYEEPRSITLGRKQIDSTHFLYWHLWLR